MLRLRITSADKGSPVKKFAKITLTLFLLLASLSPLNVQAQEGLPGANPQSQAAALLAKMTPEERVGQLFLFTFKGTDVSETSQIYDLVFKHHIGGVVMLAKNDNFVTSGKTLSEAYRIISSLQTTEWNSAQKYASDPVTGKSFLPNYIPLFIGTSQEGDGSPNDQLLNGLTMLPNDMALGATWNTKLATQVGKAMGNELDTLGFNFLLGPSLDVLEIPHPESAGDMGTRAFGGDPYWVGEMAKAYISGLHQGSNNRMAVIAKNFPGRGSSDRSPEEEVATILKSLDQLKSFDLPPFFDVTGNAPTTDAVTDGLLVSHIRYQGFQGNIRATTRPVSSDQVALSTLMALPELATWRNKGGVLVSDDLGSRAMRRFYDPSERTFDANQVARNAFLAGNDLLFADDFIANGDLDAYTTILRTLSYFAQNYRENSVFAQRVDASVSRILQLKFKLYGSFETSNVIPAESGLLALGKQQPVAAAVASAAVTLINPSQSELDSALAKPPALQEHIIFFTDVMTEKQCSQCAEQTVFTVDGLQKAVLRLYGPQAGGQVTADRLSSYSLADLSNYMKKTGAPADLETNLQRAEWVVFAFLDASSDRPGPAAVRQLLSQRPDLLLNKKVIAFAFNAPYYLDATDISKLTAYYALYSKTPEFVDIAARVLFQEMPAPGALPVSVTGIGYDLINATQPDPNQIIPLMLDLPEKVTPTGTITPATPGPTAIPRFKVGDSLPLRTGVIYDHNHNPVPDNTPVHFIVTIGGDIGSTQTIDAYTSQGIAHVIYRIDKSGLIEIRATSEPATRSDQVFLDTSTVSTEGAALTAVAPTSIPSKTPTLTPSITPTLTSTVTITPTPSPTPIPLRQAYPNFTEWLLSLIVIAAGAALAFFAAFWWMHSILWGLRWSISALLGGLVGYLYLALGLPGSTSWVQSNSTGGIISISSFGIIVGWLGGVIWRLLQTNRRAISKILRSSH